MSPKSLFLVLLLPLLLPPEAEPVPDSRLKHQGFSRFPVHTRTKPKLPPLREVPSLGPGVRILEAGTLTKAGDESPEDSGSQDEDLYYDGTSSYNARPPPRPPATTDFPPLPSPTTESPSPPTDFPSLVPTIITPVSTRPPSPVSGTQVPILGLSRTGDLFPPSPPTADGFPPSPPASTRSLFSGRAGPSSGRTAPLRRPVGGSRERERPREPAEGTRLEDPNVIRDYMFSEIKCYRTKAKEYFGAKIHLKTGFHLPYVRDRPQDPMTSSDCNIQPTENPNTFHMKMADLRGCGVETCGDSMCVTMVFPRVPSLALADDEVTTIKCLPQKSSMSEMRTISFAGDSLESRRSGSTVEGGGQDFAAEVGVFRQNPGTSNGLFAKRVNSGGVVQLGERLQLRSVVRGGDGWTFSRLTDVKVWRMREAYSHGLDTLNPKDASEVITLVDGTGCRNPDYQVIAEADPLRDPRNDLVHHFTFKAFLFRGQRANEPLIVTAKVQACQERDDCQFTNCGSDSEFERSRYKRAVGPRNASVVQDWSSASAFRVVGLDDLSLGPPEDFPDLAPLQSCGDKMGFSALGGSLLMLLLLSLTFTLFSFCRRGKRLEDKFAAYTNSPPNPHNVIRKTTSLHGPPTRPLPQPPPVSPKAPPSVAQLLQELRRRDTEADYEAVPPNQPNQAEPDQEDVYVVYCCKGGRSRSAPPRPTESEEEAEEWSGGRRTVRSVKRRHRSRDPKLSSVGSFPCRVNGGRRTLVHGTRSLRHKDKVRPKNFGGNWSEGGDSVYGTESSDSGLAQPSPPLSPNASTATESKANRTGTHLTHMVTRNNDSSTQIIIIPETNV